MSIKIALYVSLSLAAGCTNGYAQNAMQPLQPPGALQPSQSVQDTPATDCDKYAASPLDSGRKTVGVPFEKINPDLGPVFS
jgi:hypothetical protein